jgi:hypothetical protein
VPLENRVTWPELGLRGVVILVDHSRDDGFSAYGSEVGHITDRLRLDVRGPLEPGLMWPVPVVVDQVLADHPGQVAFTEDQEPFQELTADEQAAYQPVEQRQQHLEIVPASALAPQ